MPRWSTKKIEDIFRRAGGRCSICRQTLTLSGYGKKWNVDHLQPVSRGGTDDIRNLTVTCIRCNSNKGNNFGMPDVAVAAANEVWDRMGNVQPNQDRRNSTNMFRSNSNGRSRGGNSRRPQRKGTCAICGMRRKLRGDRCNQCIRRTQGTQINKKPGECAYGNCLLPLRDQGFLGFGASRYCTQHQNQADRGLL